VQEPLKMQQEMPQANIGNLEYFTLGCNLMRMKLSAQQPLAVTNTSG